MDARERRLVENEAVFREVNEHIKEAAGAASAREPHVYEFLCECSNSDCTILLELSLVEYEHVRRDPTRFVVAPGHDLPEIEDVIFRSNRYQMVRKRGAAAAIAEDRDPRA